MCVCVCVCVCVCCLIIRYIFGLMNYLIAITLQLTPSHHHYRPQLVFPCPSAGIGVSCSFLGALIVTGISFHKKRHLAVPIVTMSGGVGVTCFPSLLRWLVDEYALRGMFLILAGICLNVVLFGLVVRTFGASKGLGGKDPETEMETEEAERKGNIRQTSDEQTDGEMLNLKQRHAVVTISENLEVLRYDCENTR